jgi:hypothetical protein
MKLEQALLDTQGILGSSAVVELSVILCGDERREVWSVGLLGADSYSWQALGVSTSSFEDALQQAQGKRWRRQNRTAPTRL